VLALHEPFGLNEEKEVG
jgi:hypothetical protein